MHCLEKYRNRVVRQVNRDLRRILLSPEEKAVHDFRVGVKRLSALYYFLQTVDPRLDARQLLKPYRALFKTIGGIRDAHIAIQLLEELDELGAADARSLKSALRAGARRDYRQFRRQAGDGQSLSIRTPTIRATGIGETAILRRKPAALNDLLQRILRREQSLNPAAWHRKRILLKRYHHTMEAFHYCPGHATDDAEIRQIRSLEQLLGDWHDHVVTIEILRGFSGIDGAVGAAVGILEQQDRTLLGAAAIYLNKFGRWHGRR